MEALRAKFEGDVVMDFKTHFWTLTHREWAWSSYFVIYAVRSRLVQTVDGRVLWLGYCRFEDPADATWEQLMANAAELLWKKFDHATETCSEQLLTQLLGAQAARRR